LQVQYKGENRPIGRPILPPGSATVRPDEGPGVPFETGTRPPLEGPYAFSRLPRPADDLPKIFLRNDLPATWLFANTTTDGQGNALLTVPVPDITNTSWILTGFAINQLDGMGVSEGVGAGLELFQPFYVLANLPYSVRVNETLAVEMVVFNYLSKEISAEVTLENPNGSGFLFGSANPNEIEDGRAPFIELHRTKRITVRPSGRTALSFIITPLEIGMLEVKITAKSSVGQDVLVEQLRVEAEGETVLGNKAHLIDLTNRGAAELNVTVDIPRYAVPSSGKVFVAAVPDPLGPSVNNLEALLGHLPTGCGEQNMVGLVPGVLILDYLRQVRRSSQELERRARHLMQLAYQNQLGEHFCFLPTIELGTVQIKL
jgi:CD109 antigen